MFASCKPAPSVPLSNTPNTTTFTDTLNLLFVGDIMCHSPQYRSVEQDGVYDFSGWFDHIRPIISSADVAIGNLETTLSKDGPYGSYPRFRTPESLADGLLGAGFDVLVTANNHSNDDRVKGVVHTIDKLKSLGIQQTGTFKTALDKALHYPLIFTVKGVRIGLINYTYDTNGIPTQAPTLVNEIDTVAIKADIQKARSQNVDLLFAFMHWGSEYRLSANSKQKRLTQMMLREGVDHIIGAHPHVVQPIEIIDGVKKKHLVAYSLGNFISNQKKPNTDLGLMLKMSIIRQNDKYSLLEWEPVHIWRYKTYRSGKNHYKIIPISSFVNDTSYFDTPMQHQTMMEAYENAKSVVPVRH